MKVGIYCRLSEEDRNKQSEFDESASIQNQKAMLLQYAGEKGWEVYDIYSDDDYTGSDRNRPQFKRLINDAKERKIDIVLCKTQSRFTRELELVEKYIHGLFPIWGVRFVSVVDNADTSIKGNKKARQINGLINEWYLEDMSDNIRSVLTNRRQNGFFIGAFAPYGYKKDPDQKGHLIIDEEAAAVVHEIFTMFVQGYGKTAIARSLNDRGIPNATEYKRLHGLRYKGPKSRNSTLWKYFAISDILCNETYIGNLVQGRYGNVSYKTKQCKPRPKDQWIVVKNTHEPIIEKELWDKAQALIAQRAKPFTNGQVGLFARKARCMYCGYTMQSHKKSDGRRYLSCPNYHIAKDACSGSFISVSKLEQMVLAELKRLASEFLDKDKLEQGVEFNRNLTDRKKKYQADVELYKKKIDEHSNSIKTLYMDKVRGVISEDDFIALNKSIREDRERLSRLIDDYEIQISEIDDQIAIGDNRREIVKQYVNLTSLNREIVVNLIDYVSVGRRIPGTKNVPIEIHWAF